MKHLLLGLVVGAAFMFVAQMLYTGTPTEEEKNAAYFAHSAATLVSPHNLRERMSHGKDNYVLIDIRAAEDYAREHIVTAINIDTSETAERTLDDILADFKMVVAENPNKEIIIYCYSAACMNGRKAGDFLAKHGVYVKEMTVGWNEWRYGWEMWNYDTEWDAYRVEDYVISGTEPGIVPEAARSIAPCNIEGTLSC